MADPYVEVEDGEWIAVTAKKHLHQCCDCGLVHTVDYRLNKEGQLEIRARRNNRATAALRRRKTQDGER